jgi:transcriptional regulator with XRE-family HTH domain
MHRYLLDAPTRIDREAAVLVACTSRLNLPRRWNDVRRWDDLAQEEAKRLLGAYGEEAFRDVRQETGDPSAHGRLLKRRTTPSEETVITLTEEAENTLSEAAGCKGFRKVIKGEDGLNREYLIKRFKAGPGYVEGRLSWYGQAWPLVDEGRRKAKRNLEALCERARVGYLFEDLDDSIQEELNGRLRLMESIRDAREVMAAILTAFGAHGENPLRVPAWNLRTLLECEKDAHGFRRVRGCLRALQEIRFHLKAGGIPGLSRDAVGPFLGSVTYIPRGRGEHTDGDFYLNISEAFIGCLKVFQTNHKISDARKILIYDWSKKLSGKEQSALGSGYLRGFSTLAPYLDRARGFTETQINLRRWIEDQITRNKDETKRGSGIARAHPKTSTAGEPRLYGRDFCPILPDDRLFHGALGHFKHGERGRTLFGTPSTPTKTSGAHAAGLLRVMGYRVPRGATSFKCKEIARRALGDIRAVVEEAFGGVVAGFRLGRWLSLKDAEKLPTDDLLKRVSWHLFLARDWRERIPREVEAYHEKRHARGETDYLIKTTRDRGFLERAEVERGLPTETVRVGAEPLRIRLYVARKERKLSQAAVGRLFGVSQQMVGYWERGTEPGENGKIGGKAIRPDTARLVNHWIETGLPPSEEERTAITARGKPSRSLQPPAVEVNPFLQPSGVEIRRGLQPLVVERELEAGETPPQRISMLDGSDTLIGSNRT